MVIPVFKIIPSTQSYDWGKIGESSKVAKFANASKIPEFTLELHKPYAELWMGTHPSSPSHIISDEKATLSSYLAAHPELIGESVAEKFKNEGAREGNLPFLFKILAIQKALSIQTHPDKATAEKLHREQPNVYKDANHKPEMAIALSEFTALCGFLPLPQIAKYLTSAPEFAALVPEHIVKEFISIANSPTPHNPREKSALKELFSAVMTAEESLFKGQLGGLVGRYSRGGETEAEQEVKDLILTLNAQFPGDIGVFCAFMLNYVKLKTGEAIFLAAGEPHAYITGDIVETMATSDNVIRAGLTPKLRDVPNLISGLTYEAGEHTRHLIRPVPLRNTQFTDLYDPPIPEFSVVRTEVRPEKTEVHAPINGPSVAIVTEGRGVIYWGDGGALELKAGEVLFIGAGTEVKFGPADELISVYRAYVDVKA